MSPPSPAPAVPTSLGASVYEQDCETFRYQNDLRWGRIKTVVALEAAVLTGLIYLPNTHSLARCVLAFAGLLVTLLLSLSSERDDQYARAFWDRARMAEGEALANLLRSGIEPWWRGLRGRACIRFMWVAFTALNALAVTYFANGGEL